MTKKVWGCQVTSWRKKFGGVKWLFKIYTREKVESLWLSSWQKKTFQNFLGHDYEIYTREKVVDMWLVMTKKSLGYFIVKWLFKIYTREKVHWLSIDHHDGKNFQTSWGHDYRKKFSHFDFHHDEKTFSKFLGARLWNLYARKRLLISWQQSFKFILGQMIECKVVWQKFIVFVGTGVWDWIRLPISEATLQGHEKMCTFIFLGTA